MIQIKIERIGDDRTWALKEKPRAWCAILTLHSLNTTLLISKKYLKPNISYLEANGVGSRGVYAFYNLENNNYYEINEPISWKKDKHYFCKVENNKMIILTREEIFECLRSRSE